MFSGDRMLFFFFFNDTATTEIYTLSLHDALPISVVDRRDPPGVARQALENDAPFEGDRKSTRLNSSHLVISYAVFCLKKKKKPNILATPTTPTRRIATTIRSLISIAAPGLSSCRS